MVYIWAVEALGKGPSEPKTTEVSALFDVRCEKCNIEIVIQNEATTKTKTKSANQCVSVLLPVDRDTSSRD